jgi:hypothetical protein
LRWDAAPAMLPINCCRDAILCARGSEGGSAKITCQRGFIPVLLERLQSRGCWSSCSQAFFQAWIAVIGEPDQPGRRLRWYLQDLCSVAVGRRWALGRWRGHPPRNQMLFLNLTPDMCVSLCVCTALSVQCSARMRTAQRSVRTASWSKSVGSGRQSRFAGC